MCKEKDQLFLLSGKTIEGCFQNQKTIPFPEQTQSKTAFRGLLAYTVIPCIVKPSEKGSKLMKKKKKTVDSNSTPDYRSRLAGDPLPDGDIASVNECSRKPVHRPSVALSTWNTAVLVNLSTGLVWHCLHGTLLFS